ncbi:MAG: cell division topological specificity factor MinE [Anaerolineaceae bacterium]|nr:cell division topological specificity factor MinE [Anaerolineaceae bacterium]
MTNFFDRMFGKNNKPGTGATAKARLEFVLVHDRINLPPERMAAMKAEILEVIAKYVSYDHEMVDISLEQRDRSSALVADIPFQKAKDVLASDEDYDSDLKSWEESKIQQAEAEFDDATGKAQDITEPSFIDDDELNPEAEGDDED